MAIKEELAEEVKEEGGGEAELEALDALETEAKEFNKVTLIRNVLYFPVDIVADQKVGFRNRPHPQSLQTRRLRRSRSEARRAGI